MQAQLFNIWFNQLSNELNRSQQRHFVLLIGNELWAHSLLSTVDKIKPFLLPSEESLSDINTGAECLIYGDSSVFPTNVNRQRYRDKLGSEADLIFFSDSQFNLDALAALSGTLKAGGVFFLIAPQLSNQYHKSLSFQRFYNIVFNSSYHTIINESDKCLSLSQAYGLNRTVATTSKKLPPYPHGCLNAEQVKAVEAVIKVSTGRSKRPLVITADRGRGKSSALAIACAMLLKKWVSKPFEIIVSAPVVSALSVFFKQLGELLPGAHQQGHSVRLGKANLKFMTIDQLVLKTESSQLVIVDEAAGVPVYILKKLLGIYNRMVFATTVHGYEGAGRGFLINFKKILNQLYPQSKNVQLHQPIRWRQGDPLERLIFKSCLLKAEISEINLPCLLKKPLQSCSYSKSTRLEFKRYLATDLIKNETLLAEIFSVLITAHYQTKPSDLQLILDNKQVEVACLMLVHQRSEQVSEQGCTEGHGNTSNQVVAVALVMHEGKGCGVNHDDVQAIKNSRRRIRNNFLPQSLLSHCGDQQAFEFHYLRIMRIAVHPAVQQQGVGLRLMAELENMAHEQKVDFLGASFGVHHLLLKFWFKAGYSLARIGFTKDKASGEHSAIVINGLSDSAKEKQMYLHREFFRSLDYLLLDEYQALDSKLVQLVYTHNHEMNLESLSTKDRENVVAYGLGKRQYSSCVFSIFLWFKHELLKDNTAESIEQSLVLVAYLLQKQKCAQVCSIFGLTGKKMLDQHIKNYVISQLNKP